jgi:hypothetical protein
MPEPKTHDTPPSKGMPPGPVSAEADGVVHARGGNVPQTHVLIVGVGRYPFLHGGGAEADELAPLGQLTSPTVSARVLAEWFLRARP